jgi:hypothetical protein
LPKTSAENAVDLPPNTSEKELNDLLKPYLSAIGLEQSDWDIAKPKGKWWAIMRINDHETAEDFLEQYGYGQGTGIKFAFQQGKSLKFEAAQGQDEEECKKIREENEAESPGCCVVM